MRLVPNDRHRPQAQEAERPIRAIDIFVRWDALHYLNIADHGYTTPGQGLWVAFFPVYPLILRGFRALGLEPMVAGAVLNHLLLLLALVVLFRFVAKRGGAKMVVRVAAIVVLTPATFYFSQNYPDTLLALLFISGIAIARSANASRPMIALAAVRAAIASACRPQGLALAAFFSWWRSRSGASHARRWHGSPLAP